MEALVGIMQDVLSELKEINLKLDDIKGFGSDNSLSEICNKLDDLKGIGLYNSLSDVCDKIDSLESTITLGENY